MDNFIARGAAQQTYLFYGPIMRALSYRRMTLLIGANHVIRVAALHYVGLLPGASDRRPRDGNPASRRPLAERLRAGSARDRRGADELVIVLQSAVPVGFRLHEHILHPVVSYNFRMRPNHAFSYFLLEQFYFSGFAMAIAVAELLCYYLFGWVPANFGATS